MFTLLFKSLKLRKLLFTFKFFFYNNLKFKFCRDLTKLTNNITIKTFLQNIKNNKKKILKFKS